MQIRDGVWCAVHVKPLAERTVSVLLRNKGYEEFVPTYHELSRLGRCAPRERPLFPRYVFCRVSPKATGMIVTTPGVLRILGIGGRPEPVREEEIDAIRRAMAVGVATEPWERLEQGDEVLVMSGPLVGCRGVFKHIKGKDRLVISLTLLKRSVLVEMDRRSLELVSSPLHLSIPGSSFITS